MQLAEDGRGPEESEGGVLLLDSIEEFSATGGGVETQLTSPEALCTMAAMAKAARPEA